MHSTLAIVLALATSGQLPENDAPEAIPAPPGYGQQGEAHPHPHFGAVTVGRRAQFPYPTGHIYPDVAPEGIYSARRCEGWMFPNGICGHRCVGDPHSWGNWWVPPGTMLPHYHYFSGEHGYYYFAPYNVTRIAMQQSFVKSYGGDPRHPYSHKVFEKVYEIYGKRHGIDQDGLVDPLPPPDPEDNGFSLEPNEG